MPKTGYIEMIATHVRSLLSSQYSKDFWKLDKYAAVFVDTFKTVFLEVFIYFFVFIFCQGLIYKIPG